MDPTHPSPKASTPTTSPPSPKSPIPKSPPPPVSPLAPSSPQQQAQSTEEIPTQAPSQAPDAAKVPKEGTTNNEKRPKRLPWRLKSKQQVRLTHKEGQCHELIKKEKKMQEHLRVEIDCQADRNEKWLKATGLYDFATLPWGQWKGNIYAKTQMELLQKTRDEDLKKEFGPPKGGRQYFMLKNVEYCGREQLKWFLERVCFLAKYDYMSKENWAPLYFAKNGGKVTWAHWVYDRIHAKIFTPDKRKTQLSSRLAAFLSALFAFAQRVDAGEVAVSLITPIIEISPRPKQEKTSSKAKLSGSMVEKLKTIQDFIEAAYIEEEAKMLLAILEHKLLMGDLLKDLEFEAQTPSRIIGKTFNMPKKRKLDTSLHEVHTPFLFESMFIQDLPEPNEKMQILSTPNPYQETNYK
ncbi:hypothetical protein L7F22_027130 [Adiantum nelumboides]|nr:hypothetical protein [Adiantum nelumboides]